MSYGLFPLLFARVSIKQARGLVLPLCECPLGPCALWHMTEWERNSGIKKQLCRLLSPMSLGALLNLSAPHWLDL